MYCKYCMIEGPWIVLLSTVMLMLSTCTAQNNSSPSPTSTTSLPSTTTTTATTTTPIPSSLPSTTTTTAVTTTPIPSCPQPPIVQDADLLTTGPFIAHRRIEYQCHTGFKMSGLSNDMLCDGNLQWTGSPPQCLRTCPTPPVIANAVVKSTGPYTSGDTVEYECSAGFLMTGQATRTCGNRFTWEGSSPSCNPTCPNPPGVANAHLSSAGPYPVGSQASYACGSDFQMDGSPTLTCGSGLQWQGSPPTCKPIDRSPRIETNQHINWPNWGNGKNTGSTFTGDTGGGFPTWLGILLGVIFGLLLLGLLAWLIWACCCGGGCCGVQGCMGGGGGTAGCQGCCPRRTYVANETEYVRYSKESPVAQKRVVKKKITRQNNEPEYDVEHAYDHVEIIHLDDDREPKRQNKSYGPNVRKEVHFHENDLKDRTRPLKSTNKQTPPEVVENVYYHHKTRRSAPKEDPKPRRRSPSPSPSPPPPASPSPVQQVIRNEIHVIEDSPPSSQQTTPRAPPPPPVIQPVQPPAPPKKRLKNDKLQDVIHAVVVNKKKKKIDNPQKPLWWPHSKPVRQINTSTK